MSFTIMLFFLSFLWLLELENLDIKTTQVIFLQSFFVLFNKSC